jgi:general stress protein 26
MGALIGGDMARDFDDDSSDLEKFYELIDDMKFAMLTTRRVDGHLRARAMATQRRAPGADLWFVTSAGTAKIDDIKHDPHVNLSYFRDSNQEWVSVSGTAILSRDRLTITRLYSTEWRLWFPDRGDSRDGTAEDPRIVLIGVTVHAAEFLEATQSRPVVMYELLKGWLTGTSGETGVMHELNRPDARR